MEDDVHATTPKRHKAGEVNSPRSEASVPRQPNVLESSPRENRMDKLLNSLRKHGDMDYWLD